MRRLAISARLTLLFSATSVVALVSVALTFLAAIDRQFDALAMEELRGRAALVERVVEGAGSEMGPEALGSTLEQALADKAGLSAALVDAGRRTLHATAGAEFPDATIAEAADSLETGPLKPWSRGARTFHGFALRLSRPGPSGGPLTVLLALEGERHQAFLAGLRPALALVVGIALVVSVLGGWATVRYGLAPLDGIASRTRGITADGQGERLCAHDFPRELEGLVSALNEMRGRIEAAFRKLSDFSTELAHELRTPITNLITQTEVALSKERTAAEYREVLYSNLEEFRRQARMVEDMLFLAKADRDRGLPETRELSLAAEVDALLEFYEPLAERAGVRLVRIGEAAVRGDALMLRRALGNLLANAMHHTTAGGRVTFRLAQAGRQAVVSVSNPGPTIAPADLGHLFDRFSRVRGARGAEGEGTVLGLAITKSIVEAHRGSISVTSGDGCTTFRIVLPAASRIRGSALSHL